MFPPDIFITLQMGFSYIYLMTKPYNTYLQSHTQQKNAHFHRKMAHAILWKFLLQKLHDHFTSKLRMYVLNDK